jgi:hypothetical protein
MTMPTILQIHYTRLLIPDSVNVNTLLNSLRGAKLVDRDYKGFRGRERYVFTIEGTPEIGVEIVSKDQVKEAKKPLGIPEKASPDANGKDFFRPE